MTKSPSAGMYSHEGTPPVVWRESIQAINVELPSGRYKERYLDNI